MSLNSTSQGSREMATRDMRQLCREKGLDAKGSKSILSRRLRERARADAVESGTVTDSKAGLPAHIWRAWSRDFIEMRAIAYHQGRGMWVSLADAPPPSPELSGGALRVVTFNILFDHYLGGSQYESLTGDRTRGLLAYLRSSKPDVAALQEVTPKRLGALLSDPWIRATFTVCADRECRTVTPYGQIFLVRRAALDVVGNGFRVRALGPAKKVVEVRVRGRKGPAAAEGATATFLGVHLTSGFGPDRTEKRLKQLATIKDRATQLLQHEKGGAAPEREDIIVMGDFNFYRGVGGDDVCEDALSTAGLIDAWGLLNPDLIGVTHNPRTNEIARAFSKRGIPERYDRVYGTWTRFQPVNIRIRDPAVTVQGKDLTIPVSDHSALELTLRLRAAAGTDAKADDNQPKTLSAKHTISAPRPPATFSQHFLDQLPRVPEMSPSTASQRSSALDAVRKGLGLLFQDCEVLVIGSQRLGTARTDSDIDIVVAHRTSRDAFFSLVGERLASTDVRIRRVSVVRALVPVVKCECSHGVFVDVQYVYVDIRALPGSPRPTIAGLLAAGDGRDELRKLYLAADVASRAGLDSLDATWRLEALSRAHREDLRWLSGVVGRWARARGIYVSRYGLLSGISTLVMSLCTCLELPPLVDSDPRTRQARLLIHFFQKYASWPWSKRPVALPGSAVARYAMTPRERMAVLVPGVGGVLANTLSHATEHTRRVIEMELSRAQQVVAQAQRPGGGAGLAPLFSPVRNDFFAQHRAYIRLTVSGSEPRQVERYGGYLESRVPNLLTRLQQMQSRVRARPLPIRFERTSKSNGYPCGFCLYVGLTRSSTRPPSPARLAADAKGTRGRGARSASPRRRGRRSATPPQVRRDMTAAVLDFSAVAELGIKETENIVVAVDLVNMTPAKAAALDLYCAPVLAHNDGAEESRNAVGSGGGGVASEESPGTDSSAKAGAAALPAKAETHPLALIKKRYEKDTKQIGERKQADSATSASKFPFVDAVLNRIEWDSSLDPSRFTIVYLDRFTGLHEISVAALLARRGGRGRSNAADDKWMPLHRLYYIKMDGEIVWDRLRKQVANVFAKKP